MAGTMGGAMGLNKRTIIKLLLFNAVLLAVNVVIFSNAFLKIRMFNGSALESAIGLTVIIISIALFFYVNLQIINAPLKKIDPKLTIDKINSLESCFDTINRMGYSGTFSVKMSEMLEQIQKMQKKKDLIKDILLQKFTDTEMSYQKFKGIVDSSEGVMCLNIKSIINRIYAFDEEEYNELVKGKSRLNKNIADQKIEIFKQYIDYVEKAVEDNDEILLKLDKLLLEISKFNSIDAGELENMEAMKELDSLITDTKWYK
jgi:uncharacterized protein Yka (UPF0111/DUF47 family)